MLSRTEILIDWLQLYGHGCNFNTPLFEFKNKPYGTKHFNIITDCYYCHSHIAEIAHQPRSHILHSDSVLIKFTNATLYKPNLKYIVNLLLSSIKFNLLHVTRVDFAVDFPKFANAMDPQKFINKFLHNKLLKIGRGQFKLVGTQKHVNSYEYIRFGSNASDVSAYLYNKSLELNQVHNKPYIRENWVWYKDKQESWQQFDTWRLEFSVKNHKLTFLNHDTGELIPISLESVLSDDTRQFIYSSLLDHYFYFVHNNGTGHKERMRKVSTFDIMESPGTIIIPNDGEESGRMHKIFIRMFEEFNNENRRTAKEIANLGEKVLASYMKKYDLKEWKNLNVLDFMN
jgi:hypothetical protein